MGAGSGPVGREAISGRPSRRLRRDSPTVLSPAPSSLLCRWQGGRVERDRSPQPTLRPGIRAGASGGTQLCQVEPGEAFEPSRAGPDRGELNRAGRTAAPARWSSVLGDGSLSSSRTPLHRLLFTEWDKNYYQVENILKTPRKGILGPCPSPLVAEFSRVRQLLGDTEGIAFGFV